MNTLYKYLNDSLIVHRETFESLFDAEDDLLDKVPQSSSIDWLLNKNNANISNEYIKSLFINNNGEIDCNNIKIINNPYTFITITLYKPLPDWIRFDKKLSDTSLRFSIEYSIKSQRDLPKYGEIYKIKGNLRNIIINNMVGKKDNYINIDNCNSIKNITLHGNNYTIYITVEKSKISFKDIAEIKSINNDDIVIYIDKKNNELGKILSNIVKDKKYYDDFISRNQQYLAKMFANGVAAIIYNGKNCVVLEYTDNVINLIETQYDYI